jgi:hypothetical protein
MYLNSIANGARARERLFIISRAYALAQRAINLLGSVCGYIMRLRIYTYIYIRDARIRKYTNTLLLYLYIYYIDSYVRMQAHTFMHMFVHVLHNYIIYKYLYIYMFMIMN